MVVKGVLKRMLATVLSAGMILGGVAAMPSVPVFAEGDDNNTEYTVTIKSDEGYLLEGNASSKQFSVKVKSGNTIDDYDDPSAQDYLTKLGNNYSLDTSYRAGYVIGYYEDKDGNIYYPGYGPGDRLFDLKITKDSIFTVHWKKQYTVTYDYTGGCIVEKRLDPSDNIYEIKTYEKKRSCDEGIYEYLYHCFWTNYDCSGNIINDYILPEKDGYQFVGWKDEESGSLFDTTELKKDWYEQYKFIINKSVTFKAVWKKVEKDNSSSSSQAGSTTTTTTKKNTNTKKYSNEWVDGKWYNKDGSQTYKGTMKWKSNSKGWWIEDTAGWYPTSQWQKIDGKWYYFCADGYMDYSEYREGCWLGSDGAWDENYSHGAWHSNSKGWWYEDNGWYPANQWVWIDGTNYYFGSNGYWSK